MSCSAPRPRPPACLSRLSIAAWRHSSRGERVSRLAVCAGSPCFACRFASVSANETALRAPLVASGRTLELKTSAAARPICLPRLVLSAGPDAGEPARLRQFGCGGFSVGRGTLTRASCCLSVHRSARVVHCLRERLPAAALPGDGRDHARRKSPSSAVRPPRSVVAG